MKRFSNVFGKLITVLAVVLVVLIASNVPVKAEEGKTVRVSTAKQLKAAIKDADVGTIIFRTNVYAKVTIKAVAGSEEKFLIVDAPNVTFVNKAVFAGIEIQDASVFCENVSGNKIRLGSTFYGKVIVGKKKQLDTLVVDSLDIFYPNYILRKGAKLKNYEFVSTKWGDPIEGGCDMTKRKITLKYTNPYGFYESYTIKFDKNGRITSNICESDGVEFGHKYYYTYNSNGDLTKITGSDNEDGEYTRTYTYSDGKLEKITYESSFDCADETVYKYNKEGVLVYEEYNGYDSMDGQHFYKSGVVEYDDKGRVIYQRDDDLEYDNFWESSYTYNSKGFLVKAYYNTSGSESYYTYKYNKAGDMVKVVYQSEGTTDTLVLKYNDLGEMID